MNGWKECKPSMKNKVCMLTTVHQPYDTRVFHKEAKSLAKVHNVVLIAPDEGGADKEVDGVRIITVKKPGSKVLHPITMWRVFKAGFKQDCDVYHCHEPGSLFVCAILKVLRGKKLIYDAHEHYPSLIAEDSLFPDFTRPLVRVFADVEERVLARFADVVITVDENLASKYKKHHKDVVIISNYPKLSLFSENKISDDLKNEFERNMVLLYVGGLTKDRGTLESIQALQKIVKKVPNAKLVFLGEFKGGAEYKEEVISYVEKKNFDRYVEFSGYVPHEDVVEYMNMAKVGTLFLQPIPRYINAVSIKLFEYMACGLPVVASNFPAISRVVKEADCGILVDPTDVDEIADAMVYMLEYPEEAKRMGENGRRAVEEKYNWERMEERLLELYEGLK